MINQIYLASRSPRRQALLKQLGVNFSKVCGEIDESQHSGESAADYVVRLATQKAQTGWQNSDQNRPVLGADTIVVCDGEVFGKPQNQQHAKTMLKQLSGRVHLVMTAVAICQGQQIERIRVTSEVEFAALTEAQMDDYWLTGEPVDKAGGYAIQGYAGVFVKRIHGSYSAIVGLPLFETLELLKKVGWK